MNGIELADAVRVRWPAVEVIVTSGRIPSDKVMLPYRAEFFAKPYDPGRVVAALHRMLAAGATERDQQFAL